MGGLIPLAFAAFIPEMSGFLIGAGGVLIAIGLAYLFVSYGLLKGKRWAWTVTVILSYIGIITSIIAIAGGNITSIPHLIISIAIIYFLYKPQVKEFFGKRPNAYI